MKEPETTFEEDMKALDETVRALERGDLDLDAALQRFENGVQLARRLRKRLDAAESRVQELLADGSVRPVDIE